jgi:hypothetical protein
MRMNVVIEVRDLLSLISTWGDLHEAPSLAVALNIATGWIASERQDGTSAYI